jgi:hypothetical protein
MVSKTNGRRLGGMLLGAFALWALGCPAWHSASPPTVPPPSDPLPCDRRDAGAVEGEACAPNGATCELQCRDERGYCVMLVCEQFSWRRVSFPPPQEP